VVNDHSDPPYPNHLSLFERLLRQNPAIILDKAPQAIFLLDPGGRLLRMSDYLCRMLGYSRQELLEIPISRWDLHWTDSLWSPESVPDTVESSIESTWQSRDGRLVPVAISRTRLVHDGDLLFYCIARDISLRKDAQARAHRLSDFNLLLAQANKAIAEAEHEAGFLQHLCDLALQYGHLSLVWIGRPDDEGWFHIEAASGATSLLEGFRSSIRPDIPEGQGPIGNTWRSETAHFDFNFPTVGDSTELPDWKAFITRMDFRSSGLLPLRRGGNLWGLLCVYHRDSEAFDSELQNILDEIAQDLSRGLDRLDERSRDRKRTEFQQALIDNSLSGILMMKDRQILYVNQRLLEIFGYEKPEELEGRSGSILYASEEEFQRIGNATYPRLKKEGTVFLSDLQGRRKNGEIFWRDVSDSLLNKEVDDMVVVVTVQDVTVRHLQTERLKRLSEFNTLLRQANQTISRATDERSLLKSICDQTVQYAHLPYAWIGRPDEDGWFRILSSSPPGEHEGALVYSSDPSIPEGQGPAGLTWRYGISHTADTLDRLFPSLSESAHLSPGSAHRLGIRSGAFFPVFRGDALWAVFGIYASEDNVFSSELITLVEEFTLDISRGLDRLDAQKREKNLLEVQQALLDNTVSGIMMLKDRLIIHVNARLIQMFGYDRPEELLGHDSRILYPDQGEYERIGAALSPSLYEQRFITISDVRGMRRDGEGLWIDLSLNMIGGSQGNTVVATLQDVTTRHRQTEHLKRLSDFKSLLAEARQVIAMNSDEPVLLQTLCNMAVKYSHADIAWIGQPDGEGWFRIMHSSGMTEALKDLRLSADPARPEGRGEAGTSWRTGRPYFNFSLAPSEKDEIPPSHLSVFKHGMRSIAALPLMRDGKQWAILSIIDRNERAFDPDLQSILDELARNISQGLERIDLLGREREVASINRAITDNALAGFILIELAERTFRYVNSHTLRLLGYPEDYPIKGQSDRLFLADEEEDARLASLYLKIGKHGEAFAMNVRFRHRDGHIVPFDLSGRWVGDSRSNTVLWTMVEASERSRLQERIEHEATHDPLTDLPNRRALEHYLVRSLARARRNGTGIALGILDLDDFKPVNDTYGHSAGDRLLREFAARLRFLLRENDFVIRLGGDEFVVILEDLKSGEIQMLDTILSRLHQSVETPFEVHPGRLVSVGMTMGLALFPEDGEGGDLLLRHADLAMYQLKVKKLKRERWWQRGLLDLPQETTEEPFDPFGPQAISLVEKFRILMAQTTMKFGEFFSSRLAQEPEANTIFSTLSEEEIRKMRVSMTEHLEFLIAPSTTEAMIEKHAEKLGEVHALVGIGPTLLLQAKSILSNFLAEQISQTSLPIKDRYQILMTLENRLNKDIHHQLEAQSRIIDLYFDLFSIPLPQPGAPWTREREREITAAGRLPGLSSVLYLSPDNPESLAAGKRPFDSFGFPALELFEPDILMNATRSWLENRIQHRSHMDSFPRSTVFLPIRTPSGLPVAILYLAGIMPHQFESPWSTRFLLTLQRRWEAIYSLCHRTEI
jgi:diguanylate cyclase (GGDEF)-like protein/PAS domain S-box-containing protein